MSIKKENNCIEEVEFCDGVTLEDILKDIEDESQNGIQREDIVTPVPAEDQEGYDPDFDSAIIRVSKYTYEELISMGIPEQDAKKWKGISLEEDKKE